MTPQQSADKYGFNLVCSYFRHKRGDIVQTDGSGIIRGIQLVIVGELSRSEAVQIADQCGLYMDECRLNAPFYYKVVVE